MKRSGFYLDTLSILLVFGIIYTMSGLAMYFALRTENNQKINQTLRLHKNYQSKMTEDGHLVVVIK